LTLICCYKINLRALLLLPNLQRFFLILLCIIYFIGQVNAQEKSKSLPDSTKSTPTDTLQLPFSLSTDSLQSTDSTVADSLRTDSASQFATRRPGDLEAEVKYEARDSIIFNLRSKGASLHGEAKVNYQKINLTGDKIDQDWTTNQVTAIPGADSTGKPIGKPVYSDEGQEFVSNKITYNFKSKKAKINHMVSNEGETYLIGEDVKMDNSETIYIKNTQFTTCSNTDHPHFYLNLYKAKIIPNKRVISGPSNMVIEDIPLPIGLPFGIFPTQRGQRSGILPPEYGESPQFGFFLRNGGYYFAISDHLDLSLQGDIYSMGGWRLSPASSYNKRYKYSGNVRINYSSLQAGDREASDFFRQRDFLLSWSHNQDPRANPYRRFTASVTAGSSSYLSNNSFASTQFLQNQLRSSINFTRIFPNKPYSFNASLGHSQNTSTKQVSLTLPNAVFTVNRLEPFKQKNRVGKERWYEKVGFNYNTNFRSTINEYDSLLFKGNFLEKMDVGQSHSLPISTSAFVVAKYLQFTPSFNYSERWSVKSVEKRWDADSGRVFTDTLQGFFRNYDYAFSISMNTRLYGLKQFEKGKIAAIRHVINPQLSYSLRPDFSDSKFGFYGRVQADSTGRVETYNRFAGFGFGGPGAGRSGSLGMSVDNILEMKVRQVTDTGVNLKKIKIFDSFRFSGNYNFAADSLNLSPIQFSGRTTFTNNFSLLFGAQFEPYERDTLGRRLNRFMAANGRLAEMTNANLTFSGSFSPGGKKTTEAKPLDAREEAELEDIRRQQQWDRFVDWNAPFTLSFNYTLNYLKSSRPSQPNSLNQQLVFFGDFNITPKWKIGFNSGYDITNKKVTSTMLNFYRDLHCWELAFNLVPFGAYRSYTFTINAKGRMLQELRLTRRRDWYDLR